MKCVRNTLLFALFFMLIFLQPFSVNAAEEGAAASEEAAPLVCVVRFSGAGLYVYGDPSLSGVPVAVLADQTQVQVLEGPMDFAARIRVPGTEV